MSDSPEAKFEQSFGADMIQKSKVHLNLEQDVIVTTEDKLRLALRDVVDSLDRKKAWIAPVSLFVTILLVFATTEFRDALLFDAATWKAVFLICGIGTFLWSAITIYRATMVSVTIDSLVADVKQKSDEIQDVDT